MKKQFGITLALALGLLASNAATADDTILGALLGGGAGVLVGHSVGGRDGAIIGGALGAAAGAAIAAQNDRPRSHYAPPAYLSSPFQKFAHVFSGCQFEELVLRPTIAHACDQGVKIGPREFPLERMRDAFEIALEVCQSLGDCLRVWEVVRGEDFALYDREIDFDLVKPTCVDRTVNRDQSWMNCREAPY